MESATPEHVAAKDIELLPMRPTYIGPKLGAFDALQPKVHFGAIFRLISGW